MVSGKNEQGSFSTNLILLAHQHAPDLISNTGTQPQRRCQSGMYLYAQKAYMASPVLLATAFELLAPATPAVLLVPSPLRMPFLPPSMRALSSFCPHSTNEIFTVMSCKFFHPLPHRPVHSQHCLQGLETWGLCAWQRRKRRGQARPQQQGPAPRTLGMTTFCFMIFSK